MKTALVIGSPNSIHVMNFINSILLRKEDIDSIVLFSIDHNSSINAEYEKFYRSNRINIFGNTTESKAYNRIEYFLQKTILLKKLLDNQKYDYCFPLYISEYSAIWVSLFYKKFNRIVLVFWGGDVLRNKRLSDFWFRNALNKAYKNVLPNLNTLEVFNKKTDNRYKAKSIVIQYPQKMVGSLLDAEKKIDRTLSRKEFGFPSDKIIVICGHTATRAEHYLEVIDYLDTCDAQVKEKCYFVFMMTYAPEEYKTYQSEVENRFASSTLNGVVLKEYLSYDKIMKLHFSADIHITAIKTDALSCFLQEELFAGSILIYGKWLNYYELENDDFCVIPFDELKSLPKVLKDVVDSLSCYKNKSKQNRAGIIKLASEESIIKEWANNVFTEDDASHA